MRLELNPRMGDARYLEALNSCFGNWGGKREFDWYFRREFAGRRPDRFVIFDGDEWIAGSGLTWRTMHDREGQQRLIGIMTGSWTLPPARGRGCFKAMIEASRERCIETGAAWLLAFVTSTNASRRSLEMAGSMMIPTHYLWSPQGARCSLPPVSLRPADSSASEALRGAQSLLREGKSAFCYPDAKTWTDQFIDRPFGTEVLAFDDLGYGIIETHNDFDRLLAAIPHEAASRPAIEQAVCRRALQRGKRYFTFCTTAEHIEIRQSCGLEGTDGFITLLPAREAAPPSAEDWLVESGDRV